jgi:hypothetical protein
MLTRTIKFQDDFGAQLCEVLGVDASTVSGVSFELDASTYAPLYVKVTHILETETAERLIELFRAVQWQRENVE